MDSTIPASLEMPIARRDAARIAAPILVFIMTVSCFLTTMRNGFVNWDDIMNFLRNADYQAASWDSVYWAFTARHGGHYQPLNWLTFIADHAITPIVGPEGPRAGDDPYLVAQTPRIWLNHPPSAGRFHQTQAILHGVAAVLVYFLSRRLLGHANDESRASVWAPVFAALVFGLHPLRVESVAWASARTDILAVTFMLCATLVYLKALDRNGLLGPQTRLIVAGFMLLALGSKVMAVTLPAVLLIVDVYYGRLKRTPLWTLILEKAELLGLALAGVIVAIWAHASAISNLEAHSFAKRLAQLFVSIAFYPYKTLAPVNLSPLYEHPVAFGLAHPQFLYSLAATVICAAILAMTSFSGRRAVCCALAAFIVLILPVSGLTQRGPQMVADRYSYVACIPFALLAGGAMILMAKRWRRIAIPAALAVLAGLTIQTQRQIRVWHDSKGLWEHAIALDRTNATAFTCLGSALDSAGDSKRALELYEKAVAIRHTQPDAWLSLGNLYSKAGRDEDAIRCYRTQLEIEPQLLKARAQLCRVLAKLDRLSEAEPHLRILLADPSRAEDTLVRHMLADACAERGALAEAIFLIDEGIELARRKNQTEVVNEMSEARAAYLAAARELATLATQPASQQADGEDVRPNP